MKAQVLSLCHSGGDPGVVFALGFRLAQTLAIEGVWGANQWM